VRLTFEKFETWRDEELVPPDFDFRNPTREFENSSVLTSMEFPSISRLLVRPIYSVQIEEFLCGQSECP
jgi:hypothetical protein